MNAPFWQDARQGRLTAVLAALHLDCPELQYTVQYGESGAAFARREVAPRIGMKVIAGHLRGDPDTHKGNSFNELRVEDERGKEEISLRAQKDRHEKIGSPHTGCIGKNWVRFLGHNVASGADNTLTEIVGGDVQVRICRGQRGAVVPDTPPDKTVPIDAGDSLTLRSGAAGLVMEATGDIKVNGKNSTAPMDALIALLADKVRVN